jgi:hypothetical protein
VFVPRGPLPTRRMAAHWVVIAAAALTTPRRGRAGQANPDHVTLVPVVAVQVEYSSVRCFVTGPRSEDHHAAQHVAVFHLGECRLDVPEPDRLGHELLQRKPPVEVQVDEHREVPRRQAVPVPR